MSTNLSFQRRALACCWGILLFICATTALPATFDSLVAGVQSVSSGGSPGPVFGTSSDWSAIAGGDEDTSQPSTLVIARTFGLGRVIALGHDGLLSQASLELLDNATLMTNIVYWLKGTRSPHMEYSTGHGEWANGIALGSLLSGAGFTTTAMSPPITKDKLRSVAVFVPGNAWSAFTTNEIQAVSEFVSEGGGLLLTGLGWSWVAYHPGQTMEEYPMTQMAAPYGCRWLSSGISDPSDNLNGSPVFRTFYPNVVACTLAGAMQIITNAHVLHGVNLSSVLETNVALRTAFTAAHAYLAVPSKELPLDVPSRQEVLDFYVELMQRFPGSYARTAPIDQARSPTTVWLRERVWATMRDCVPLTDALKLPTADAAQLSGLTREIYLQYGVVLLDNCRLATNQLGYVRALLRLIPRELYNLRSISVAEFLGTPPTTISLSGLPNGVNTFGSPITGGWTENSFPSDVSPGYIKGFCGATAHEVNHIVDVCTVGWSGSPLASRRAQLISDAGTNVLNYLRGGGSFFVSNPQEFFASIANQWFTDSEKTIELGMVRYQAGWTNPINQALFFADVYSGGGPWTYFYRTDLNGNLYRTTAALRRDDFGHITGVQMPGRFLSLTLDPSNNVSGMALVATAPPVLSVLERGGKVQLSWSELPIGYTVESSSDLKSSWSPVTNRVAYLNGTQLLELPFEQGVRFFRLRSVGP